MRRIVPLIRGWLRRGARDDTAPPSTRVPVLLASEQEGDGRVLESLLHDTRWTVAQAFSWGDVSGFCARVVKPIVIVDRHFQGSDWRFTVSSLLNSKADSCLILLSDVADPYLWNELVRYGGFDVLARPLDRASVFRTLVFAQRYCESGWPALHSPQDDGTPA